MTNIASCCMDVDTNLRITISIYNGTGRFLRISDFYILNSERSRLQVPTSDFRISERLDLQMLGLWFLDFQISRFLDFEISRFLDFKISRFLDLP